jgi:chromosome segregation ATPase
MRVVCVAVLLAVCASATLLSHPGAAKVQQSAFGSTVLAELESKLATGSPLDELKSILDDIRGRLKAAGEADKDAQIADTEYCNHENATYNTAISGERATIQQLEAEISSLKNLIAELTLAIEGLRTEIARLEQEMQANLAAQAAATAEREDQHEHFINNTRDSKTCIDAIDEIKALPELQDLINRQNDHADHYQEGVQLETNAGARMTAMLSKVSNVVTSEHVTSMLQIAALAAATLENNVDKFVELLNKLRSELSDYVVELQQDEDQQVADYTRTMGDLTTQYNALASAHRANLDTLMDKEKDKDVAEANLIATETEEEAHQKTLAQLIKDRDALTLGCETRAANHQARMADRAQENATLDEIERIISEKLSHHFANADSHLNTRLAGTYPVTGQ